jgi:hypothetical protein
LVPQDNFLKVLVLIAKIFFLFGEQGSGSPFWNRIVLTPFLQKSPREKRGLCIDHLAVRGAVLPTKYGMVLQAVAVVLRGVWQYAMNARQKVRFQTCTGVFGDTSVFQGAGAKLKIFSGSNEF